MDKIIKTRQKTCAISSNINEDENIIEFGDERDAFLKARTKSPKLWILSHILHKKNKILVVFWFLCIIGSTFITALISITIGDAIDQLTQSSEEVLLVYFWLVFILSFSTSIIHLMGNISREFLAQKLERDVRDEFYLNLLGKSLSFHDQQKVGDIMARSGDDVRMLNYMISPAISLIFDSILSLLIPTLFIMTLFPHQLLIVPLSFIILFSISIAQYFSQLGPITQKSRNSFGEMISNLNQSLNGIEVVKGLTLESIEKKKYLKSASRYRDASIAQGKVEARYLPLILFAITVTAGLLHTVLIKDQYSISTGQIIAYVGLLLNFQRPTRLSLWTFSIMRQALSSAERIIETLNKKSMIGQNLDGISNEVEGHVKFENVCFTYPNSKNSVLKSINFEIEKGKTIAIVGATGSGKTTLTKLISRLYEPTSGCIFIDGIAINNYSLDSLRGQISYIEQDIYLFSSSIKDNIGFGKNFDLEDIIAVAKKAQADDFINNLPDKYDTLLGENGVQLSGGERQRLAIARAFLSDPKILILDDSTSAIDSETEDKIQKAMANVQSNRTTFLITHRLSQIRWADKILVLKKGQITAVGNHYQLLKECEEYRKIFTKKYDKNIDELLGGDIN